MIAKTNRVKDVAVASTQRLMELYDEREASAIIYRLFEERFGITRRDTALDPRMVFSESQLVQVHKDLKQLQSGMPVQYVIGHTWFLGHKILVGPGVLIPRPETEELALAAFRFLPPQGGAMHIVDIGTGSGALAIAVKMHFPEATVTATDVNSHALELARKNASVYELDIRFLLHNILNEEWPIGSPVDCIISNPPYIPVSEATGLQRIITSFEPSSALFVEDDDPLLYYRAIGREGARRLKPEGWLFCEVHSRFAPGVASLFRKFGYSRVEIIKDLHDRERIVAARI